ncbi:Highly reducing polyketide synthase [Ascochyta lentis]
MDPAQRLTLETAYRALENAGISIERAAGSKTCVFSGSFSRDYATMLDHDPDIQPKYRATGTATNMLANRVSWFFDLTGPSVNVDTACSSSLVALDLACQSIWTGDSTMVSAIKFA